MAIPINKVENPRESSKVNHGALQTRYGASRDGSHFLVNVSTVKGLLRFLIMEYDMTDDTGVRLDYIPLTESKDEDWQSEIIQDVVHDMTVRALKSVLNDDRSAT